MSPKRWFVLAGLAVTVLACGPLQRGSPAQGSGEADTPKYGGVLHTRDSVNPANWDLSMGGDVGPGGPMLALTYDSILRYKMGPDIDFSAVVIEPELAEKWEVSPDARTFTFHLRKGLKFANLPPVNGRELTAADVKWTYEYWTRTGQLKEKGLPRNSFDWLFEGLDRVDTPDAQTVVVSFKAPFAPFLTYAAHDYVGILPREIFEQDGHYRDQVVGSGPFQLDAAASQTGTRWVFKKNPDYWEPGKPYADEVRMLVIPDDSTAYAALQVGKLDVLDAVDFDIAEDLQRRAPHLAARELLRGSPVHLYVNHSRPPFDNFKVRKAVALALDRDEMLRVFSGGKGAWPLAGAFPDTFTQEEIRQMLRHDPEEAKRLIKEAGYPDGLSVNYQYSSERGLSYVRDMELLQAQLKKIGVNLIPEGLIHTDYLAVKKKGTHTINASGKKVFADVDSYLYAIFHPNSANNYDRVNDPKLTKLLEAQRAEADPAKRKEIVREAVRYLNTECYCGIALYLPAEFDLQQPYVKNYYRNANRPGWAVVDSWLDK